MIPLPLGWNDLDVRLDGCHVELVDAVSGRVVAQLVPWQAFALAELLMQKGHRVLAVDALTAERFGEVAP